MKTGAKGGLYQKLLDEHGPPKILTNDTKDRLGHSRDVAVRRLWKSQNDPKFKKFGRRVRRLRKTMKKSQSEFARMIGVSIITIRRWELGYGVMPSKAYPLDKKGRYMRSNYQRLQQLEETAEEFKKNKVPFEKGLI